MRIRETAAVDETKLKKSEGVLLLCLELQSDVDGLYSNYFMFQEEEHILDVILFSQKYVLEKM